MAQAIDALVVALATADVIGKFAHGEANDFLTTLFLATTAPVVIAPGDECKYVGERGNTGQYSDAERCAAITLWNRIAAIWHVAW